jgi:hypothetical protein
MAYWAEIDIEDHDASGDLIDRSVEVTFTVDPGYSGSRTEPPEGPSVHVLDWRMADGLPAPDWLDRWITSDAATDRMLREAQEMRAAALDDAADARREEMMG